MTNPAAGNGVVIESTCPCCRCASWGPTTPRIAFHCLDLNIITSHHPSLRRLEFDGGEMPTLRDLAGHTQLHCLRELVYKGSLGEGSPY